MRSYSEALMPAQGSRKTSGVKRRVVLAPGLVHHDSKGTNLNKTPNWGTGFAPIMNVSYSVGLRV